jgi:hypothetical protein
VGVSGADLARGVDAFVGVRGWHADVDDRHVRLRAGNEPQRFGRVARQADDLMPRLGEQAGNALARDERVVGDRYPHGISIVATVPSTAIAPSHSSTRSVSALTSPRPAGRVRTSVPGPLGETDEDGVGFQMFAGVAHDLLDETINSRLDRGRVASLGCPRHVDPDRRRGGERVQGGAQARIGEDRGVDAVSQRAQLLEDVRGLGGGGYEHGAARQVAGEVGLEPQLEQHREYALLRAVVEIALEVAARGVAEADNALARGPQLRDASLQLLAQQRVGERQSHRRAERALERPPRSR